MTRSFGRFDYAAWGRSFRGCDVSASRLGSWQLVTYEDEVEAERLWFATLESGRPP